MLVLVIFQAGVSIFWNIRALTMDYPGFMSKAYLRFFPYLSILLSLLTIVANIYYLRFPRVLLHSIKINDEFAANKAFSILFKSAILFFLWLLLVNAMLIWNLTQIPSFK